MRQRLMVKWGREVSEVVVWWCAVYPLPPGRAPLPPAPHHPFLLHGACRGGRGGSHTRTPLVSGEGGVARPTFALPPARGDSRRAHPAGTATCLPPTRDGHCQPFIGVACTPPPGGWGNGTPHGSVLYESRQRVPHGRCLVATASCIKEVLHSL